MKPCILLAVACSGMLHAQGPLTPPPGADPAIGPVNALNAGAPQATMKTLHQVEPRTPIAGAPGVTVNPNGGFTLIAPGSYYLISNIDVDGGNGIIIAASHVSLDLMGFTIRRTAGAEDYGAGVALGDGTTAITARNGSIVGGTIKTGSTPPYSFSPAGFHHGVAEVVRGKLRHQHGAGP